MLNQVIFVILNVKNSSNIARSIKVWYLLCSTNRLLYLTLQNGCNISKLYH